MVIATIEEEAVCKKEEVDVFFFITISLEYTYNQTA